MTLVFEPKTVRDDLAPIARETLVAQAALYAFATAVEDDDHIVEPSNVFAKHDAIAAGLETASPVLARAVVVPETLSWPPVRPTLRERLRSAFAWKF